MGGDGGVIASNRRYMRGAGAADHTADRPKSGDVEEADALRTCHVTQLPLQFAQTVVACPLGRLYQKEAAVEALLRRRRRKTKQQEQDITASSSNGDALGDHIRGLKDLHEVRFHLNDQNHPACPITGDELNEKHPCVLLVGSDSKNNVISERAKREMGMEALEAEYGTIRQDDMIRLAPPPDMLKEIQEKLKLKRKKHKKSSKEGNKRTNPTESTTNTSRSLSKSTKRLKPTSTDSETVADAARTRVASAVAQNEVLSSLFTSKSRVSEKEKKDNLFARV